MNSVKMLNKPFFAATVVILVILIVKIETANLPSVFQKFKNAPAAAQQCGLLSCESNSDCPEDCPLGCAFFGRCGRLPCLPVGSPCSTWLNECCEGYQCLPAEVFYECQSQT